MNKLKLMMMCTMAAAGTLASSALPSNAQALWKTANVATIQHYTAGNSFVILANLASGAYQCDRPNASFDVPYIDLASSNAQHAMDMVYGAYLAGRAISIEYGADCKINIVRVP